MLEKNQLIIVYDDGIQEFDHAFIAPDKSLITTTAAMHMLNVPSDARVHQLQTFSVTEVSLLHVMKSNYFKGMSQ